MSRASTVSGTCDSVDSATAAAADSTFQLRFKSLVRRHSSSFRLATGLLVSSRRRQSTGFSSGGDSLGDISFGIGSLRSVQTERKAVKVLGTIAFKVLGTRAVKVLGTMFLLFFISWASFFSMNLAMGLCPTCHFEELLYKWFLWLVFKLFSALLFNIKDPIPVFCEKNRNFGDCLFSFSSSFSSFSCSSFHFSFSSFSFFFFILLSPQSSSSSSSSSSSRSGFSGLATPPVSSTQSSTPSSTRPSNRPSSAC